MQTYPIAETFLSFQGEGAHCGRRAFFIRLFGCPVRCPWCDSVYAWRGNPPRSACVDELVAEVLASRAEMVVLTGGEPCIHDVLPLVAALNAHNIAVHLETSGVLDIPESPDARFSWVALSPKLFRLPLEKSLLRADELKLILSDISELERYLEIAKKAQNAEWIWLEPEWSKASYKALLGGIVDFVKREGGRFRAGWQVHKNYFTL